MKKSFLFYVVWAFILLPLFSFCSKRTLTIDLKDSNVVASRTELVASAGSLYDVTTNSFKSGTFTIRITDDVRNKFEDLVCYYSAKYTTTDSALYPYIQVYWNNPPLNVSHRRTRYKFGGEGYYCYGACKCITNGKTTGFLYNSWDGDYCITITIPEGVTLFVDSFLAEYNNGVTLKDAFKVMQHGSIFNSEMNCETNWQGWSHVNNYGAIVVPKRTTDGVWVCYHDDVFGETPDVQVIGDPSAPVPAVSIQECSFAETQKLEYRTVNSFDEHDKIPTLELFLQYCVKTGVHPVFSIHPSLNKTQWQEIRALVEKYNLLSHLNIKGGYFGNWYVDVVYFVFGNDIESFILDVNMVQPTQEQISYLASKDWDLSKVSVGFEYMTFDGSYFTDDVLSLMRQKGLVHGVSIISSDAFPREAEFIKQLIAKGCYELTADYFYSNGLNW